TLAAALARLSEANSGAELAVSFHESGDELALPMPLETALLRIAQGALSNVTRHSGADRAEITLSRLGDWVGLDIVDNGRGFDPAAVGGSSGEASFGLIAIRQRVEQLG